MPTWAYTMAGTARYSHGSEQGPTRRRHRPPGRGIKDPMVRTENQCRRFYRSDGGGGENGGQGRRGRGLTFWRWNGGAERGTGAQEGSNNGGKTIREGRRAGADLREQKPEV